MDKCLDMEKQFNETKLILKTILDTTEEGILVVNNKGEITHFNKNFKEIWELKDVKPTIDEFIISIMNKIDNKNNFKEKVNFLINKEDDDFNSISFINGKIVEEYSRALIEKEKLVGRVFTFRNVTKVEKYHKALMESKEKYRSLVEFFPEGIIVTLKHKIIFANSSFLNLLGVKYYLDIIGKNICHILHKDFRESIYNQIDSVKSEKRTSSAIECKMLRIDGTEIDVETIATYFPWDDEDASIIVVRDITFKKETEESLQKSEEQYRKLIEFLPAGIFLHSKGEILFANSHFAKLMGVNNPQNLIGTNVMNLMHKDYKEIVSKRMMEMEFHNREIPIMEEVAIRPDGSLANIEVIGTPFIHEGRNVCLVVVQDITEKKKAEENNRLLNETLAYEKLRTEFFANLSHELRTPLNVIYGALQVLDMYMQNHIHVEGVDNMKKYIKIMKQNSYRLMRLANNIIDITKIDAGYLELHPKNYNIIELVEDITQSVVEYALNKNIEVTFDTDVEEKVISCDPDKIERIMLNILSNALKFTNSGGKVFVNMYDKDEHIEISIKDTGIGIPEDKMESVFKRFVQVDKSLTRNHEGSGIGLSLVKAFVELHSGDISVKSKLEEGSEFIINLPSKTVECDGREGISDNTSESESQIQRIKVEFSDIYS